MRRRRDDRGFTLLELLVGIVVLSFILLGLGGGVRLGIRAADTQARRGAGQNELDAADRLLRHMIEGAEPGNDRSAAALAGTRALLSLTTSMPDAAGGGLGDVGLGVDGTRRLLLRWTPHRHVRRLGPPPAPAEATLLRGVGSVAFAYWDGAVWQDSWDRRTLPNLVRVRVAFPQGDTRHWPDIVVAPMRGPMRDPGRNGRRVAVRKVGRRRC